MTELSGDKFSKESRKKEEEKDMSFHAFADGYYEGFSDAIKLLSASLPPKEQMPKITEEMLEKFKGRFEKSRKE